MPETEDINSSMGVWAIRGLPAMPLKLRLLVLTVCVMCLIGSGPINFIEAFKPL